MIYLPVKADIKLFIVPEHKTSLNLVIFLDRYLVQGLKSLFSASHKVFIINKFLNYQKRLLCFLYRKGSWYRKSACGQYIQPHIAILSQACSLISFKLIVGGLESRYEDSLETEMELGCGVTAALKRRTQSWRVSGWS